MGHSNSPSLLATRQSASLHVAPSLPPPPSLPSLSQCRLPPLAKPIATAMGGASTASVKVFVALPLLTPPPLQPLLVGCMQCSPSGESHLQQQQQPDGGCSQQAHPSGVADNSLSGGSAVQPACASATMSDWANGLVDCTATAAAAAGDGCSNAVVAAAVAAAAAVQSQPGSLPPCPAVREVGMGIAAQDGDCSTSGGILGEVDAAAAAAATRQHMMRPHALRTYFLGQPYPCQLGDPAQDYSVAAVGAADAAASVCCIIQLGTLVRGECCPSREGARYSFFKREAKRISSSFLYT